MQVLHIGLFSLFGIYATNALIQQYSEGPLAWHHNLALILGACLAYWPLNLWANLIGAAAILWVFIHTRGLAMAIQSSVRTDR